VEQHFRAVRESAPALNHHALFGDVAQAHARRLKFVENLPGPDQWMPQVRSPLLARLRAVGAGYGAGEFGKAALDRVEQHGVALASVASDLCFMRELEADAAALDPAHCTFRALALGHFEVDTIPQLERQVGLNHRPPAGQVEEVDDIALALDEQVRLAGTQYLAVLRPLVVCAALRAWHGHSGQSIRALRLARLLGRPDRAGTEAPDGVTEAVH